MNDDSVRKSTAPPGEVVDAPADGEIVSTRVTDEDYNDEALLIRWQNELGAYFVAGTDSFISLDENL